MKSSESLEPVTSRRLARVIWRNRLACAAVGFVVFVTGSVLVLTRPNVYQSQSSVALLPASGNRASLPDYPKLITTLLPTYVQLASSPVSLNRVAANLPFTTSESQLADEVHAASLSNTAIINIVARSGNAVQAKEIASAATIVFLAQLRGNGVVTPHVYARPMVAAAPTAPRTSPMLGLLLLLAILLGLAAGLVWDRIADVAERASARIRVPGQSAQPPDRSAEAGRLLPPEEVREARAAHVGFSTVRLVEAARGPTAQADAGSVRSRAQKNEASGKKESAHDAGPPAAEQSSGSKETKPNSRSGNPEA